MSSYYTATDAITTLVKRARTQGVYTGKPIIVTPTLLDTRAITVGMCRQQPVVFVGFTETPISHKVVFREAVWFVDCHGIDLSNYVFLGELHLLDCSVSALPTDRRGQLFLSNNLLEQYTALRVRRHTPNRFIYSLPLEAHRSLLNQTLDKVPTLDLRSYMKLTGGSRVHSTDKGHQIQGDLYWCGPYRLAIPDNLTVSGDLLITNLLHQHWRESLVIEGAVVLNHSH